MPLAFQPHAFGKYYLVDKIATGGMAEVFKAKTYSHGGFENTLVIKRILSHLGDDPAFVDMFITEAKVSAALQHANIVRIYDFGRIGDEWFMSMELLDGKDVRGILRKLARQRRYLPVEFAIYIAIEACKGLDYAHRKTDLQGRPYGIVHRDMSPSNILVSYEGEVKVADFGIAKAQFDAEDTQTGVIKGKYEYMSPEQAGGRRMTPQSDLFSLGIVLHEMLTGRRLFKTGSDLTTLEKVKVAEVPAPSEVNPRIPKALDEIVMRALAKEPADRFENAWELGQALQDYLFPQTLEQVRADLKTLMQSAFSTEREEEIGRLQAGSDIANRLRGAVPEGNWEGQTSSSLTRASVDFAQSWGPLLLGGLALLLLPLIGAGIGGLIWMTRTPQVEQVAPPAMGSAQIVVAPAAHLTVDGISHGERETLVLEELRPGSHVIRVQRQGYEPVLETVSVEPGERLLWSRSLTPLPPEPTPQVEPATAPVRRPTVVPATPEPTEPDPQPVGVGTLSVALVGGGWAWVYVDDVKLDRTAPLSGLQLEAGPHTIRVENPDLGIAHSERIDILPDAQVTVRARPL